MLVLRGGVICAERDVVLFLLQVRLVEEELSYCSYGEAYEVNCARYGREADMPIAHFKKRCCSPSGNLISDPNGEIRLQVPPLHNPLWPAIVACPVSLLLPTHMWLLPGCTLVGFWCSHAAVWVTAGCGGRRTCNFGSALVQGCNRVVWQSWSATVA